MGTQQSGVLNLKIADIVKDTSILVEARNAAIDLLTDDPNLSKPENLVTLNSYTKHQKTSGLWANIS
jgi:ATP-dependent DNA helicase RecG